MPSLVEIGPVVLKKKILKFHQCIFAILSLLGKRRGPLFQLLELPSPKDARSEDVPSLVKIRPVVLEEKILKFRQCILAIS